MATRFNLRILYTFVNDSLKAKPNSLSIKRRDVGYKMIVVAWRQIEQSDRARNILPLAAYLMRCGQMIAVCRGWNGSDWKRPCCTGLRQPQLRNPRASQIGAHLLNQRYLKLLIYQHFIKLTHFSKIPKWTITYNNDAKSQEDIFFYHCVTF